MPELEWEWWLLIMITTNTLFNVLRYYTRRGNTKKQQKLCTCEENKRENTSKTESYNLGDDHISQNNLKWLRKYDHRF